MDRTDIIILTGLSTATINKISGGKTDGFSEETINQVKHLLAFKQNYTDALFSKAEFNDICSTILQESNRKDSKNIVQIIRLAHKCLRRHRTLIRECENQSVHYNGLNIKEIFGPYYKDTKQLILDPYFVDMVEIAIKRNHSIREFADLLLDIHDILQSLNERGDK